jgi:hypothetical protein
MRDQDLDLPSVDAVVVPVADKSCYETVVRSTVPRNTKPNTVVVSTYNMSNEDYLSLRKLDGVRILFGQKSYAESLNAIVARTHGDLLLFIDGNVKVPALYVEKSIAAYLDNKNAIYCAACTNLLDIKQTIYGMKNVNDKTVFNFTYNNNTNYNAIDILFGGLYVMSRQSYNKIIANDTNWQNMQNLSSIAKSLNIPLFCMNNLVVDHDRKNTSSSALARK